MLGVCVRACACCRTLSRLVCVVDFRSPPWQVIDYRQNDFSEVIRDHVDAVYDAIGGCVGPPFSLLFWLPVAAFGALSASPLSCLSRSNYALRTPALTVCLLGTTTTPSPCAC